MAGQYSSVTTAPRAGDLITIVLPTYNRKEQLKKAIESVTSQGVPGVRIHVYDNCSEDGTDGFMSALAEADPRITYIRRDFNIGALPNYVDALSRVETPYYLPLADDDWLLEGSLQILLDAIEEDPSLGAVVSQTVRIEEEGAELGNHAGKLGLNPDDRWQFKRYEPSEMMPLWIRLGHFEWSSILFRTAAKNAIGGPDIDTYIIWDLDFQQRLFSRFPVRLIKYESAVYLLHAGQSSREESREKYVGMLKMVMNAKAGLKNPQMTTEWRKATNEYCLRFLEVMARNLGKSGAFADFLFIVGSCWRNPEGRSYLPFLFLKWRRAKFRKWRRAIRAKIKSAKPA